MDRLSMVFTRALGLIAAWLLLSSAVLAGPASRVLVLHSTDHLLPASLAQDNALVAALPTSAEVATEFLDAPRFSGATYTDGVARFLREKYATWPPDLLVTFGDEALLFVLKYREELFSQVPVISAAVQKSVLKTLEPLPQGVVAMAVVHDFVGTIELALSLHPHAKHLVLVTGASPLDHGWESELREAAAHFKDRVTIEYLAGLPTDVVLKRLGELGQDAVVVTPGYFRDGAGHELVPVQTVKTMADASPAPLYRPFETFIDTGIVGGSIMSCTTMGQEAGKAASTLLAGTPLESLRVPAVTPATVRLDWRQVDRWGINPDRIPADAIVDHKPPPLLEQYRKEAIVGALVVLVQSALIALLLVERRRRRGAERAIQRHHLELAHACRLATAGELTASIAHEINQPLGAILSNAEAADLLLDKGCGSEAEVREILADIRRDDLRASEVIRRLRTLLISREVERQAFDLTQALAEVSSMLEPEARQRRIALEFRLAPTGSIVGDRVQIQQVLVNLILNAMDAMADTPEGQRKVSVSVEPSEDGIGIAVSDRGQGIAPEHLPRLFDSFFSTKRKGMGLGLSIARTIVEAHGGRIRVENAPDFGATFHISLPAAQMAEAESLETT